MCGRQAGHTRVRKTPTWACDALSGRRAFRVSTPLLGARRTPHPPFVKVAVRQFQRDWRPGTTLSSGAPTPPESSSELAQPLGVLHTEPVRPACARDQGESVAAFPAVNGRTLLSAHVLLPADLPADRTLAVVAFQRWQQSRVGRWIERAVAAGVPPTTRGVTGPSQSPSSRSQSCGLGGGRCAASSTVGRRQASVIPTCWPTITVYTDVAAFQRSLAIPCSDDVHALVVDRDGIVLARGYGDPDDMSCSAVAAGLHVD